MTSRIGGQIKTAAIGMLGMAALDVVSPLISQLVGGVLPGAAAPAGGASTASLVDAKTAGVVLSLVVVAKARPGGAVHTAASFALAKWLYDMFGGSVKSVLTSVKIPGLSGGGLGWLPTTSIPAFQSDTVTGRTYSQLNSAYAA